MLLYSDSVDYYMIGLCRRTTTACAGRASLGIIISIISIIIMITHYYYV